jgi:ABC-2 type transport system permease protein
MSWSRIRAIYRKDLRDAVRDSRVLTAVLMPLMLGVIYSFIFSDDVKTQKIKVGIVSATPTQLQSAISNEAPPAFKLTFVSASDAATLEGQVRRKDADIGLVLPPGFDAALGSGATPTLTVLLPSSPGFDRAYVAAVLDRSVRALSGQAPPARIVQHPLPPASGSANVLDVLGARTNFVLISIVLLLAMIAVYAVPAVLVEETEKKTIDALTLIASSADVIAAKALFGIALSVVAVPVLLVMTRGRAAEVGALVPVVAISAVVLVGLGLLLAGLFRTQQQVNTWSGAFLLALLAPAFTVGMPTPDTVNAVLWVLPTGHSFRLIANAFAGRDLYPHEALSYAVLIAWAAGAYGLLWWRLARQEAA